MPDPFLLYHTSSLNKMLTAKCHCNHPPPSAPAHLLVLPAQLYLTHFPVLCPELYRKFTNCSWSKNTRDFSRSFLIKPHFVSDVGAQAIQPRSAGWMTGWLVWKPDMGQGGERGRRNMAQGRTRQSRSIQGLKGQQQVYPEKRNSCFVFTLRERQK